MSAAPAPGPARRGAQKLAVAACVLLLLAVADACWLAVSDERNLFRVVAGAEAAASGDLVIPADEQAVTLHARVLADGPAALSRHVRAELDTPDLEVRFVELQGRLWRARILAHPGAPAGDRRMAVRFGAQPLAEAPVYTVRVFPDAAALRADQPSLLLRLAGVQPFWAVLALLPVALLAGALVYRQGGRDLERLLASGTGPIYRLARRGHGWEVVFGLGRTHGVLPGDRMIVLDPGRRPVGDLVVLEADTETATATVPLDANIGPGHFVARADRERT